MTLTTSNH